MLCKTIVPALAAGLLIPAVTPAFAANSIRVGDNWFVRSSDVPTVTVAKNSKVTWRWTGKSLHNVTVTKGPAKFRSGSKTSGRFSRTLTRSGTYTIICTVHGASDQKMKLVVR